MTIVSKILHVDLHTFPQLPEIVRDVAEDGLEGEDEADPLVPRVTDLVAFLGPAAMEGNQV